MSSSGEPAGGGGEEASSPAATASASPPARATTAPSPATLKKSTTSVLSPNSKGSMQKSVTLTFGNISPANSSQVSEQLEQSLQTHKGKEKEETDGPPDTPGGRGSGSAGGSRVFADDSGRQLSQVSRLANSLRFSECLESAGSSQPSQSQPDAAGGGGEGTSTSAQQNGAAAAGVVSPSAASPYRSPGGGGETAGSPYGAETAPTPVLAALGGEAAPGSPSSASAASPAASPFFMGPSPKASGAGAEEDAALRSLAAEEAGARGGVGSALSSCSPQAAESRRATAERSMSTQCALDFRYTAGGSINPALGHEVLRLTAGAPAREGTSGSGGVRRESVQSTENGGGSTAGGGGRMNHERASAYCKKSPLNASQSSSILHRRPSIGSSRGGMGVGSRQGSLEGGGEGGGSRKRILHGGASTPNLRKTSGGERGNLPSTSGGRRTLGGGSRSGVGMGGLGPLSQAEPGRRGRSRQRPERPATPRHHIMASSEVPALDERLQTETVRGELQKDYMQSLPPPPVGPFPFRNAPQNRPRPAPLAHSSQPRDPPRLSSLHAGGGGGGGQSPLGEAAAVAAAYMPSGASGAADTDREKAPPSAERSPTSRDTERETHRASELAPLQMAAEGDRGTERDGHTKATGGTGGRGAPSAASSPLPLPVQLRSLLTGGSRFQCAICEEVFHVALAKFVASGRADFAEVHKYLDDSPWATDFAQRQLPSQALSHQGGRHGPGRQNSAQSLCYGTARIPLEKLCAGILCPFHMLHRRRYTLLVQVKLAQVGRIARNDSVFSELSLLEQTLRAELPSYESRMQTELRRRHDGILSAVREALVEEAQHLVRHWEGRAASLDGEIDDTIRQLQRRQSEELVQEAESLEDLKQAHLAQPKFSSELIAMIASEPRMYDTRRFSDVVKVNEIGREIEKEQRCAYQTKLEAAMTNKLQWFVSKQNKKLSGLVDKLVRHRKELLGQVERDRELLIGRVRTAMLRLDREMAEERRVLSRGFSEHAHKLPVLLERVPKRLTKEKGVPLRERGVTMGTFLRSAPSSFRFGPFDLSGADPDLEEERGICACLGHLIAAIFGQGEKGIRTRLAGACGECLACFTLNRIVMGEPIAQALPPPSNSMQHHPDLNSALAQGGASRGRSQAGRLSRAATSCGSLRAGGGGGGSLHGGTSSAWGRPQPSVALSLSHLSQGSHTQTGELLAAHSGKGHRELMLRWVLPGVFCPARRHLEGGANASGGSSGLAFINSDNAGGRNGGGGEGDIPPSTLWSCDWCRRDTTPQTACIVPLDNDVPHQVLRAFDRFSLDTVVNLRHQMTTVASREKSRSRPSTAKRRGQQGASDVPHSFSKGVVPGHTASLSAYRTGWAGLGGPTKVRWTYACCSWRCARLCVESFSPAQTKERRQKTIDLLETRRVLGLWNTLGSLQPQVIVQSGEGRGGHVSALALTEGRGDGEERGEEGEEATANVLTLGAVAEALGGSGAEGEEDVDREDGSGYEGEEGGKGGSRRGSGEETEGPLRIGQGDPVEIPLGVNQMH
uniref:Uncharacterized protein n=1 Tax=Chromera velia CCMP2878 TaxID=1169474 RepID=A0A0G4FXR1_9ALVE|eukprot:Cvel_19208.t1-p1 / transcript=Cvel_19208.t1 / gene=Cvel_19208 / organism=Chromera_velia_CCMP2878 / gene_product=hypothetical protein / transcript_product=hypothetical protein / location=Cvel_scaffold1640:2360-14390(+) / protein_length=1529 / sequence_SO=supercontig / SO=protein_coding / is_pseudo=false